MNTRTKNQHRLLTISVAAGLILTAMAFLKPAEAGAGVVVRTRVGGVGIAVAAGSPRGVIVQTGPRSYRCDIPIRPPRPRHGRHVWVAGHYEMTVFRQDCRRNHKRLGTRSGRIRYRRTRSGCVKVVKGRCRVRPHDHYRETWVPGHWERV